MNITEIYNELRKPPVTGWTSSLIWRGFFSACAGFCIAVSSSLIITIALVEITVSKFFATYFGILFMSTGGILIWRIRGTPLQDFEARKRRRYFMTFAALTVLSGFLSIFIRTSWLVSTARIFKVLLFGLLGMSISFAVMFSTIDLINIGFGLFTFSSSRSPVDSNAQVTMIISVALLMGAVFGLIFGMLDVTNQLAYHVKVSLIKQESINYPIAGIVGAFAGFANEYLRNQEEGYIRLKQEEYDAAI